MPIFFDGVYNAPTKSSGDVYVGPNPPLDPEEGDIWFNTVTDELFIYD